METLEVTVKPGTGAFSVTVSGSRLVVTLKSRPEGGRANQELVKGLSRHFGKEVRIVSGFKSRKKLIQVY